MSERFCPACAAPVPSSHGFCGACGTRLPASESTATEDALIGRVIDGRFRVLRLLGTGGMGAVYLAEHVGIGKRVAVKVLRADLRADPDLVRRFRREAMAVSKLADVHTIAVFDFGVWKSLVYLVMEYLVGRDLSELIEPDLRLAPAHALRIAHQICSSLTEAHLVGVVHRDLKPENIFLTRTASGDELVKVLDFGLAKMVAGEPQAPGFQTQDGAVLGTPYYMAPEQIEGEAVGPRTDLYALGALLFRLLTGRVPYVGRTPMQVLDAHRTRTPPPFREISADLDVPEGCEALVRRLMARAPDARPPDAQAVDREILHLLEGLEPGRSTVPPGALPAADAEARAPTLAAAEPPRAPVALPDLEAPPTRTDFERYERALRRRVAVRWAALLLLLGAGGAAAWHHLRTEAFTSPAAEVEPNDDAPQATRIAAGAPIAGHLGRRADPQRSDRDVFVVQVPGGRGAATFEVTGVPGIDLIVEGFDAGGTRLFEHDEAKEGEGEAGRYEVAVPELYVVVREVWVKGQRPSENSTDAYRLTVRFDAAAAAPDAAIASP